MTGLNILDVYASEHRSFIHGGGVAGTEHLLSFLPLSRPGKILDIGHGTGATMFKILARQPEIEVHGLESSPAMHQTTRRRLKFCRISKERYTLFLTDAADPVIPNMMYDAIYAESVFALIPETILQNLTKQIHQHLNPDGSLILNESVWLDGTSTEEIAEINKYCRQYLGINQAHDTLLYLKDWISFFKSLGFDLIRMNKTIPYHQRGNFSRTEFFSTLFTFTGKFVALFHRDAWQIKQHIKRIKSSYLPQKQYLESYILEFKKNSQPEMEVR